MGRIKNWLMDMEEDAQQINLEKFIRKHGKQNANVWHHINGPSHKNSDFDFYNTENDLNPARSPNGESIAVDENTSNNDIPF